MRGKKAREIRQAIERSKLALSCFEGLAEKVDNHEKRLTSHAECIFLQTKINSDVNATIRHQIEIVKGLSAPVKAPKKWWPIWKK